MKQTYKGRAFFLVVTKKGNFAVIETEDVPHISEVFNLPREVLREADVVVYRCIKDAKKDKLERITNLLNYEKKDRKNTLPKST